MKKKYAILICLLLTGIIAVECVIQHSSVYSRNKTVVTSAEHPNELPNNNVINNSSETVSKIIQNVNDQNVNDYIIDDIVENNTTQNNIIENNIDENNNTKENNTAPETETVYTTCALNIRTGPGTSFKVINTLSKSSKIERYKTQENGWSKIIYNNESAYCCSKYLTIETYDSKNSTANETLYTTCALNIRKGPGTNYKILGTFAKGAMVKKICIEDNAWCKISYNGSIAYCHSKYLTNEKASLNTTYTEVNETVYSTIDLNIRSGPGVGYDIAGVLKSGNPITRTAIGSNEWSKVSYNNGTYYCYSGYLTRDKSAVTFVEVNETMYTTINLNIRKGPGTNYEVIGSLECGSSIKRTATGSNGWSRIVYNNKIAYCNSKYLSPDKPTKQTVKSDTSYPMSYSDSSCNITIDKTWYGSNSAGAWCYIAHLKFSDYKRFGTSCANGKYDSGFETTSHAASRLGAVFCVNGCYSAPYLEYSVARSGKLCHNGKCYVPGTYCSGTGIFASSDTLGVAGQELADLVNSGKVTDTFCFGPKFLENGVILKVSDTSRAQRTFIGTNGSAGDVWIVVSEGRYVDGKSEGLTYNQCAQLLKDKGCTFGIPLDGGGSSTMVFKGKVLNHLQGGSQRAVVDFIYFK